jgi:hypothetical protein
MSVLQLHLNDDIMATIDAYAKSRGFDAAYLMYEEARLLAEKARVGLMMDRENGYRKHPETRPHWRETEHEIYDRDLSRAELEADATLDLLELIDNTTADMGSAVWSREATYERGAL